MEEESGVEARGVRREKYLSGGTLEGFSLDAGALVSPATPREGEGGEELRVVQGQMQERLERRKEEMQEQLERDGEGSMEIEELRGEKAKMEADLLGLKREMEAQLEKQKTAFELQLRELQTTVPQQPKRGALTERDIFLAKHVLEHWRRQRFVAMAADALRHARTLKEAQVLSQRMGAQLVFQFAVADAAQTCISAYDLVLTGLGADETGDPELDEARKPCLAVRVVDFANAVVGLWSVRKLERRVKVMRQMAAFVDRPEYRRHLRLANPFEDAGGQACTPRYSRLGDADIPLAAVFECRVQDFALEVHSPYTQSVVGILRLSLEPSAAEAPRETLKFNVVVHEMVGFAEREGSSVHAQLFVPGVREQGGGATTTSLVEGFGEGPVRFGSVHSMSLPLAAPRDAGVRVSVFARVTGMHLDKLLSWDDLRDASSGGAVRSAVGARPGVRRFGSRLPEREFYSQERHDVFASVRILEIGEEGVYAPVEVVQGSTLDQGAYQLHQGLQRRIVVMLTHSSGHTLPWTDVSGLQAGNVHLLDASGQVRDLDCGDEAGVVLPLVSPPLIRSNADGTESVELVAQWDSSAHGSLLLDRPTAEQHRVHLALRWQVASPRVAAPMAFAFALALQTRPRSWFRQTSLLAQLWHSQRVVHSTARSFCIALTAVVAKRARDLWRMDTAGEYISGEETLTGWAPRGVSLIRDFVALRKRQLRFAEIEAARGWLSLSALSPPVRAARAEGEGLDERQRALARKVLALWTTAPSAGEIMLLRSTPGSPEPSAAPSHSDNSDPPAPAAPLLTAVVAPHPKNPALLKAGWLLAPDATGARWVRRYVELRRPYLHLYSAAGDEVAAINLTDARIDAAPLVAKLLRRETVRLELWAVYATNQAWVFACRNERERGEWIWAVDRAYVGGE
ncbi:hypothetical protein LTR08_004217 [Meristemomyces frigidus]|nr:hypothetical protein LTR08_004217 [Meristemomyces frigidus]